MKTHLFAAGLAVCLSAGAAGATTVTIDFEDQALGVIAGGTDINGLMFNEDILIRTAAAGAGGPGQDGNIAVQYLFRPPEPFSQGQSIGASFNGFTVSAFSVVLGDSGGDEDILQLQGFDSNGNLVDQTDIVETNASQVFSISGAGIASVFFNIEDTPANFDGSSNFDNITFTREPSVVPLPASLPLLGAGFGLMAFAARRKTRG